MKPRTIAHVIHASQYPMGPLTVRQPLPSRELPFLDPFVLLHHVSPTVVDGQRVEAHPHRGFAPVSFIFSGGVRHRDSRGNDHTIGAGGTQWMHAGSGILHEETPVAGELEMIQLWINSPSRHKMDPPSYHPLTREQTPQTLSGDGLVTVNVIAGELNGVAGPIPSLTPVNAATVYALRGGHLTVPLPATHNAFIYLLDGSVGLPGGKIAAGLHLVLFGNDGDAVSFEALDDTRALLMSGAPIGEKVVTSGPFVMNTEEEIQAAFRDYRSGAMGHVA